MANTHGSLSALFTAIANSIRGKDGTTAAIKASDFPARIRAIDAAYPDGKWWRISNSGISGTNKGLYRLCYGNGKFVGLCNNSNQGAYSTDGVNWTPITLPITGYWQDCIGYGKGKFVAFSLTENKGVASNDGINWHEISLPSGKPWQRIAYGNGVFIASSSSNTFLRSIDGENWTEFSIGSDASWDTLEYCNDKFITLRNNGGNYGKYSYDGITWYPTALPRSTGWKSVSYGKGIYIAMAIGKPDYGYVAAYSYDGINWNPISLPTELGALGYMTYGNGKFVAVGPRGNDNLTNGAYSIDGLNWVKVTLPTPGYWYGLCWGNGRFVVSDAHSSNVLYSLTSEV